MPKHGTTTGRTASRQSSAGPFTGVSSQYVDLTKIRYPDSTRVQILLRDTFVDILGTKVMVPFTALLKNSQELSQIMYSWIESYAQPGVPEERAYATFRMHWIYYRLVIPLQLRLMVEQLLYERGYPWRGLVTGFNPVKS